ncbi:hypothetical protein ACFQFQ_23900 [Sulfitobacter porphyrae]|uniref:Uncharacterized protein n=1 Tax=Sulfitobacter porphyrae TaxID=1246864 RepID=A0ABW2B8F1_9RHOB
MTLLFLSSAERAAVWVAAFEAAGEKIIVGEEAVTDPAEVTHLLCWTPRKICSAIPTCRS